MNPIISRAVVVQQARRPIPFATLWRNYPTDTPCVLPTGKPPKGFENQCAIRMSVCLDRSGVVLKGLPNECPVQPRPSKPMVAGAAKAADRI
jgi:hypothetical protein